MALHRSKGDDHDPPPSIPLEPPKRTDRQKYLLPFAGALLLSFVAIGWALWLSQRARRLVVPLGAAHRPATAMKATPASSDDAHELREQIAVLQEQVGSLTRPSVNTPVIELQPRSRNPRGEKPETYIVRFPAAATVATLILHSNHKESFDDYLIDMTDASNLQVALNPGLVRSSRGTYSFSIPKRSFPEGRYLLRLVGIRDQKLRILQEYALEIRYETVAAIGKEH